MEFRDKRTQQALIGLEEAELSQIVVVFDLLYKNKQSLKANRRRLVGAGRKGALPTSRDKVIFCLFYLKHYPTFDLLGQQFKMARSSAFESLQNHLPLLRDALSELGVLPPDTFENPDEMAEYLEKKDK